jgi:hypothetical protein
MKYKKGDKKRNKNKLFNKSIYSKEDSCSLSEYNYSDNDLERVLFMALENDEEDNEEKSELYLEA